MCVCVAVYVCKPITHTPREAAKNPKNIYIAAAVGFYRRRSRPSLSWQVLCFVGWLSGWNSFQTVVAISLNQRATRQQLGFEKTTQNKQKQQNIMYA